MAYISATHFYSKCLCMACRCHRCILAARSDYFRAFLERSPAQNTSCIASRSGSNQSEQDTHATISNSQPAAAKAASKQPAPEHSSCRCTETPQSASMPSDGRQDSTAAAAGHVELTQLAVADVTPEVFRLVLEFLYSGSVQILAPRWLKASGAEQLFEAAESYLLPLLKVSTWVATIPASGSTSRDVARQQTPQVTAKILHASLSNCSAKTRLVLLVSSSS